MAAIYMAPDATTSLGAAAGRLCKRSSHGLKLHDRCPLAGQEGKAPKDRNGGALLTVRVGRSIGSFCQKQPFALVDLSDRLWSIVAGRPEPL
jgi:hypothetical protein